MKTLVTTIIILSSVLGLAAQSKKNTKKDPYMVCKKVWMKKYLMAK